MTGKGDREEKTFDDYREAWYHTQGFGVPTQMLTVVNLHNPREIISIGIMELEDVKQLKPALQIDIKERLSHPLDEVVEDEIVRKFGIIASEDDFSAAGEIPKKPTTIDGEEVKYSEVDGTARGPVRVEGALAMADDSPRLRGHADPLS